MANFVSYLLTNTKNWYYLSMSFRNTSVSLSEHFVDFANQQISEGRYGSTSEVVRAGLRLLEEQADRLASLRAAIDAGDRSGLVEGFDPSTYLASLANRQK